jgi:hypothetical protein
VAPKILFVAALADYATALDLGQTPAAPVTIQ